MSEDSDVVGGAVESPERRDFLAKAGRFAVVTPAAVTVLLSTSMDAEAGRLFRSPGQPKHVYKHKHKRIRKIKKTVQRNGRPRIFRAGLR